MSENLRMHSRREFLQRAALLSGATVAMGSLTESIVAAARIEPAPGSSFLDAEHVVILMQENRSFDHTFGALRGVRGFNDPRAFVLPNGNPVWAQTDPDGSVYVPYRLDIKDTNVTWLGGLPHGWTDQTDARNGGRHDRWLEVKRTDSDGIKDSPFTLGHYTREDLPFYYALADAFTVCDQNFCSSLTGTTPNRLFLFSGTVRPTRDGTSQACVRNSEVDYGRWASWPTFPERLEDAGVSWKIYQNDLSMQSGLGGEYDAWLANFTDNPIEWFSQYNVGLAASHLAWLDRRQKELESTLPRVEDARYEKLKKELDDLIEYRKSHHLEAYAKLDGRARAIHDKAFTTNAGDPDYRSLTTLKYQDGGTERTMEVPKGDILHQFRKDVDGGTLPTVSWLVPPEHYSDHPGSAWFGAWYLAEVLDILTKNPEVWRKTVFILTYDENDGYFDHVPPFVAPRPGHPETGKTSAKIDTSGDYVEREQDAKRDDDPRGGPIGLGYRVPMVIASPWSRGGAVCSQIFDHTSVIQFVEKLVSHRIGKPVVESNITDWRRCVCGDLTSAFREPTDGDPKLPFFDHKEFLEQIHRAQFKEPPKGFARQSPEDIAKIQAGGRLGGQEPGTKPACPLPYDLHVDETSDGLRFRVGQHSAGAPFQAHVYGAEFVSRSYAVLPGDSVSDTFTFADRVRVDGPNGFYREYHGRDPLTVSVRYLASGDLEISVENHDSRSRKVELADVSYGHAAQHLRIPAGGTEKATVAASTSGGWYDVRVTSPENTGYARRFAGRIETGKWTITDPAMA